MPPLDDFRTDPTHVRSITPRTLSMFSRRNGEAWQRLGYANTPPALMTGVDFEKAIAITLRVCKPAAP